LAKPTGGQAARAPPGEWTRRGKGGGRERGGRNSKEERGEERRKEENEGERGRLNKNKNQQKSLHRGWPKKQPRLGVGVKPGQGSRQHPAKSYNPAVKKHVGEAAKERESASLKNHGVYPPEKGEHR
jgi:hypothetical protein